MRVAAHAPHRTFWCRDSDRIDVEAHLVHASDLKEVEGDSARAARIAEMTIVHFHMSIDLAFDRIANANGTDRDGARSVGYCRRHVMGSGRLCGHTAHEIRE